MFVCVHLPLVQIVGSTYQVLESPNPATYIGSGKVAEVAAAVQAAKVRPGARGQGTWLALDAAAWGSESLIAGTGRTGKGA
jgi:hypothetical protein